ncbi:DUF938 domain-containing protein [Leptolyngbya sp. AN02str]|uniref:DUF938 domain-containing protein n=1 Tax=Leptolyngbya sp. AN02str TaxID=3423363 RepID=UPI003D3156E8
MTTQLYLAAFVIQTRSDPFKILFCPKIIMNSSDARQYAPATQRNRDPILQVLQTVLPPQGTVLEISSGTGEHAIYFAPRLSPLWWLPSDPNPGARASIAAWQQAEPCDRLLPPVNVDASLSPWSVESQNPSPEPIVAIANINMIHIAPWAACVGLMAGAQRILPSGGVLYLYGPYKQGGQHTAPSNAEFDASLQARNPEWGVRNLEDVMAIAAQHGFHHHTTVSMPANNLSVVFRREGETV